MRNVFLLFIVLLFSNELLLASIDKDSNDTQGKTILINYTKRIVRNKYAIKDTHEVYKPFLRLYLGGFHASSRTSITLNSEQLGKGTTIDPEEVLGLDEKKVLPRVEALVDFKRHEFMFNYWTVRRTRTRNLEKDIQFGDTTFYENMNVTTKFNLSNYTVAYRYLIFDKYNWNAGLSIGAKVFDIESRIAANQNGNSYSHERRIYAPIPLLGIHGSLNPGKHFLIRGSAEYFRLGIKDWDFQTIDARIGFEYYPIKHVGIGVDYHFFDTFIEKVPSGKLNGEIEYRFNAVSLYLGIRI